MDYLERVALAVGFELLVLLGPAVAIGVVMHALSAAIDRQAQRAFGFRTYYLAAGWLGTAVHEAGHAVFALLFGHRISAIKWFDVNAREGTLGHVQHHYDRRSLYQQLGLFFIGVGPLVFGGAVMYAAARGLLGAALFAPARAIARVESPALLAGRIGRAVVEFGELLLTRAHLGSWRFWLFLYLAFAVGGRIGLSRPDLALAARGLGVLVALLAVLNAATLWAGDWATRYALVGARFFGELDAVLLLVAAANAVAAVIVLLIPVAFRAARR